MKWKFLLFLLLPLLIIFLFVAGLSFWSKNKYVTFHDAVKSIASTKPLPALPKATKPKELRIISAQYGAKDQWLNVTKQLQEKIHEKQLFIYASHNIVFDAPAFWSVVVSFPFPCESKNKDGYREYPNDDSDDQRCAT